MDYKVQGQLNQFGLRTKKAFGQNFLNNPSVVRDIAEAIPHERPLVIIEVGPGLGVLTEQLARRAEKVISYEIDTDLEEALKENLKEYPNSEIRFKDFLKADLEKEIVVDPEKEYAFAANLPYYVTTPILFKVLESSIPFTSVTVMMQKEVADRFMAKEKSPDYNDLSVIANYLCEIRRVRQVPRTCFVPAPKVDSTVLQFVKRKEPVPVADQAAFFELVKAAFAQRRKTILNNLGVYLKDKERAKDVLAKAGIDERKRAQEMPVEELVRVYEATL